jgi:hypothetical protein
VSTWPTFVCPALHVERLFDDEVWPLLRRALERLERQGGRATAFVSTRRARAAERDLGERLKWLVDHGHEIAMHTHFRRSRAAQEATAEPNAVPLTDAEVVASLDGDYQYLVDHGHVPRGFCAGTWAIHPATAGWLRRRGFHYDCSFRSYALRYDNPSAVAGDSHTGASLVQGVLRIPTTASLGVMARSLATRRFPSVHFDGGSYALFYLHDWDLRVRRKDVAWHVLVRRLGHTSVVPVREVAAAISSARGAR